MTAYSIRQSLQGALQDFVRASGFENIHVEELIRELVGLLASYREEGELLFPEVYVFANASGLSALAPSAQQVTIGEIPLTTSAASSIVKKCAPLARGGWAQFVVASESNLRFGLFRAHRHSLSISAEESLCDLGKSLPALLIRNRGHLVVDLRASTSDSFTVSLTTDIARSSQLNRHIAEFVAAAVLDVTSNKESFSAYMQRLLTTSVQQCHGTLFGVVSRTEPAVEVALREDSIRPDPALDFANLHSTAASLQTADSLADLVAAEALLQGMINSDGLVIFGTDGSIPAYKMFLRPTESETPSIGDAGGGRRRAFRLMELRLGSIFKAIFFRSQDGETDFKGVVL